MTPAASDLGRPIVGGVPSRGGSVVLDISTALHGFNPIGLAHTDTNKYDQSSILSLLMPGKPLLRGDELGDSL